MPIRAKYIGWLLNNSSSGGTILGKTKNSGRTVSNVKIPINIHHPKYLTSFPDQYNKLEFSTALPPRINILWQPTVAIVSEITSRKIIIKLCNTW